MSIARSYLLVVPTMTAVYRTKFLALPLGLLATVAPVVLSGCHANDNSNPVAVATTLHENVTTDSSATDPAATPSIASATTAQPTTTMPSTTLLQSTDATFPEAFAYCPSPAEIAQILSEPITGAQMDVITGTRCAYTSASGRRVDLGRTADPAASDELDTIRQVYEDADKPALLI